MIRTMIILLSMAFVSLSTAQQQQQQQQQLQQLPFGNDMNQWWYIAIPARSFPESALASNHRNCQSEARRDDYTYTPGIGAHKVHSELATWNEARRICKDEGGHLAIINSVAEANILGTLLDRAEPHKLWAFIGFHDYFQQGDYITVHDQSLAEAGFTQWFPGEPNNGPGGGERCGCVYKPGKLCDFTCTTKWPFVCEIPLK